MWWSGLAVLHPSLAWRRQTSKNQSFSRYFLSKAVLSSSARTIPWTLGELNFFYNRGGEGGGVRALVMDLQRYITARSVCSTCFIQARYSKAVTMSWTWGGGGGGAIIYIYIYIYIRAGRYGWKLYHDISVSYRSISIIIDIFYDPFKIRTRRKIYYI